MFRNNKKLLTNKYLNAIIQIIMQGGNIKYQSVAIIYAYICFNQEVLLNG